MALGITATALGTTAQVPAVTVAVTGDVSGRVQIDRVEGSTVTPLRGTPVNTTAGAVTVVDYEVPQASAVTYRVYPVGAPGSAVTSSAVTIAERGTWMVHPALPDTLSTKVTVKAWPEWERGVNQSSITPIGSAAPIVVSDVRQTRTGTLSLYVLGDTAVAQLEALLASTRLVLLTANRFPLRYVWASLGQEKWTSAEKVVGASTVQAWYVDIPVTETARPAVTSSGVVTWLDVAGRFGTTDALAARYGTWDALLADAATWVS